MINAEIGRAFERIADLLEIDGADRFRINSYRRAARVFADLADNAADLASEGRLTDLPGVGKGTAQRALQFIQTGRIDVLTELEKKLPAGLPALLEIPGLGPKKVALAYRELGVGGLADLKKAIGSGELAGLPGLGEKSVAKIAEGLAFLEGNRDRALLGVALPMAESLAERLRLLPGVRRVEIAGSIRRGAETIGDVDLLCDAADGKRIVSEFVKFEEVERVLARGETKGSVTLKTASGREMQIDLRVVAGESFGAAWQYFTGSKQHNVRLRERAVRKGWRLNEYGLYTGERRLAGRDEEGIYRRLGLAWVPPELREDRGEFEPDAEFGNLVTENDVRGELHVHTTASDGHDSIEDMALAAKRCGYAFLAICDHSKSSSIAGGLSIAEMKKHISAIRAADRKVAGISVLVGCEVDILSDGSLDYPDEILAQCDWVVASIHSAMGRGRADPHNPTVRTLAAMENPYVCAIGHPTGRLINRRAPMDLDINAVIEAAARTGTILEVNAHPERLDLKDTHVRKALDAGVALTINTDAHETAIVGQLRYGILTARRGGATPKDVVNCFTLAALRKRIAAKRGAASS